MTQKLPPKPDELELSLFGPGFGESVVVHLGGGRWMIVDSCLDQKTKRPIALQYLSQIGVDIAKQVVLVVVSHWHDDHIQGAATIVKEAVSARFACSGALRNNEFVTLLTSAAREIKLVDHSSGVSELSAILSTLREKRGRTGPDYWAGEGMVVYEDAATGIQVRALSPSGASVTAASAAFANLLPKPGQIIRRIPEDRPNALSVVLVVTAPGASFLLGADLERGNDADRGWHAVVSSAVRPAVKSIGFKVAHHGSENGDLPRIWTELLHKSPSALVTPYGRGKKLLPSGADIQRMLKQTDQLYSTVWPPTIKPKTLDKSVARTMDEVAKNRRTIRATPGHLRLRVPLNGVAVPVVDALDGAVKLSA